MGDALAISFDPCAMWEQMGWINRLSIMVRFGTVVALMVQGLLNRPIPGWVPVLCLVGHRCGREMLRLVLASAALLLCS